MPPSTDLKIALSALLSWFRSGRSRIFLSISSGIAFVGAASAQITAPDDRSANYVSMNPVETDFGYTGHSIHQRSGLVVAPFRFYDPVTSRWMSRDPIGEYGGINLYAYVENDPINRIDLFGLDQLILLPTKDPAYQARKARPLATVAYEVVGDGMSAYEMMGPEGIPITPKELADMIRSDPKYDPSKPVRLNVCAGGDRRSPSGLSFADSLADYLDNTVIAATTNVQPHY